MDRRFQIPKRAAAVVVIGGALLGGCAPSSAIYQPVQPDYSAAWAAQQRAAALRAYIEQQNLRQYSPDNIDAEPRQALPVSLPKTPLPPVVRPQPVQEPPEPLPRRIDPLPLAARPAPPPLRPLQSIDTNDCFGYWRICHFF